MKKLIIALLVLLMASTACAATDGNAEETIELETEKETAADAAVPLAFLDDFTEHGYTAEQIEAMRTVLMNVGITDIKEPEIEPVVYGMQVVQGVAFEDNFLGKEVRVTFNIENGTIYLVCIYCPNRYTENDTPYLSGLTEHRADLYYDVNGGYLKKIDWENRAVVDY